MLFRATGLISGLLRSAAFHRSLVLLFSQELPALESKFKGILTALKAIERLI
jgi:hypothetical protein